MVSRGTTIHHARRSSNPFMTTSSGIVGINLHEPIAFEAPRLVDNQQVTNQSNTLKEFMYQTTTQAQGDGVRAIERSKLSQRMDKVTLQKEIDEKGLVQMKAVDVVSPHEFAMHPEDVLPTAVDTRSISEPRSEHPMYTTSNREVGVDKSHIKVEIERKTRPNTFTNSFNGFRYRDFGLNTAVTKSRICDQLDHS